MSNTIAYVDNQTLTNIADAVRYKTGTNEKMLLSDIPDTIRNLDTSDITALDTRVTAVEDALADKADSAEIGDLSQLTTTAKDNLVSAINEAADAGATASAQTATTKASEATASAQSAASSAQTATDNATLASQKAAAASESASLATAKASAAATSETNAVTAAQTATTKASEAAASATSAQEYDESAQQSAVNAQTAQGLAEQAQTAAETAQGLAEQAQTAAETAQGLAEDARDLAQQYAESIDPEHIYSAYPTDTASGAVASFADGADDIPLKSLVVDINPVQDTSSGDPSPENICPISGWTGANVSATGINIWDEEWEVGGISNGRNISETDKIRSKNYIPVVSGNTYFFYCKTNALMFVHCYDSDKNYLSSFNGMRNVAVTISEHCRYIRFRMQTSYGTTYNNDISINYPSTDHDYHPYTGRFITIDLGQTVYGGKLDVLSGVSTVYPYYASYNGEILTGRWISDRDVYAVGTTPTIGAQVVNIGAEGTEIQLEPHEIASLLGANNIWADTGDSEVEYRADTTLYISRLTEPDADMIADSNIVSGQYFMVGNNLYKATANIASGSAVIVGTNATRKSLSEALNEINQ